MIPCDLGAEFSDFGSDDGLEFLDFLDGKHGTESFSPESMQIMVYGAEAIAGVAETPGEVRILVSSAGARVQMVVVFWIQDLKFRGGDADYWSCLNG